MMAGIAGVGMPLSAVELIRGQWTGEARKMTQISAETCPETGRGGAGQHHRQVWTAADAAKAVDQVTGTKQAISCLHWKVATAALSK